MRMFPLWLRKALATVSCLAVGMAPVAASASANNVIELAVSAKIARKIAQDLLARQAAYILAMESVVDTDGFPLPPAMGGGTGPVGGGLVPSGSAAPKADGYGISLGYCAWDHGTVTNHAGRLAGANSMSAVALAIVSSGSNNAFETTCAQIASGAGAQGDDYVVSYSAGQISAGVAGGTNMGMAVATYADLTALPVTALADGQVRLVKDSNTLYSYSTSTGLWTNVSATATWASITGKPTTLAGYGITDGVPSTRVLNAGTGLTGGGDLSADRTFALATSGVSAGTYGSGTVVPVIAVDAYGRITSASTTTVTPAWASITGKPTTLAGYGITDAVPAARAILPGPGVLINGSNLVGQTLGGADVTVGLQDSGVTAGTYGAASSVPVLTIDQYGRVTAASTAAISVSWAAVTAKPTTVAGYGITDAVTLSDIDKRIGIGGTASNATLTDSPSGTGTNLMVGNGVAKTLASLTSGTENIGVGPLALRTVTTGSHNIAIGNSAAEYTTTGGWNIFIGEQAGYNNIAGSGSVAIGWQSMYNANNSASSHDAYNTALGMLAMRGSPDPTQNTGKNNTSIGAFSMYQYTSGQYNTAVGVFSMYAMSSGLYNTSVGSGSLGSATTAWFNTALGYNSMSGNVSAGRNVAVGASAMEYRSAATGLGDTLNTAVGSQAFSGKSANQASNTGQSNTAIGGQALYSGTTGSHNVAVGANAGYATEDGWYNVAIGSDALHSNVSGTSNTVVGYTAAYSNVAGNGITAIGYRALYKTSDTATASLMLNTAVGYKAMEQTGTASSNTGANNTAIGANSLQVVTSGSNNVAVGINAAANLSTGSDNVAIGNSAGRYMLQSNNVAIGSSSMYGTTTFYGNNNVAIGYNAMNGADGFVTSNNVAIGIDAGKTVQGASNIFIGKGAGKSFNSSGANGNVVIGSWDSLPANSSNSIYLASGGDSTTTVNGKLAAQFIYNATPAAGNGWTIYGSAGSGGALSCNYYTGTSWSCSSDARLKENISTMQSEAVLDRFMAVRPVNYNFIGAKTKSVGFIAQELQPLFPDMVATGANGYLTVTYTDMIPVITAVVQHQQKQIQALQEGKLDNAVNVWAKAGDGSARLMFAKDAETKIRGYGSVVLDVRNAADQSVAKFGADGSADLIGSVRLNGASSGIEFLKAALKVHAWADDSVNALVVSATKAARAAVQLRGDAGQLYASVYGDASGFGLSDSDGRNWIAGSRTEAGLTVAIPGAVTIGDGVTSKVNLAHGQSIAAGQDAAGAFVRFDSGEVRVFDPKTKQDVIRLGSDGLVQAKKFAPTEVVQAWAPCDGQESHIARDEQGHVVVCER